MDIPTIILTVDSFPKEEGWEEKLRSIIEKNSEVIFPGANLQSRVVAEAIERYIEQAKKITSERNDDKVYYIKFEKGETEARTEND